MRARAVHTRLTEPRVVDTLAAGEMRELAGHTRLTGSGASLLDQPAGAISHPRPTTGTPSAADP
jgi:hypothetical protein